MPSIGIVGAGIAGLHLALLLQRHGLETALYVDRTSEELRAARLPNNVCRFERTRARERFLDVSHWDFPDYALFCAHVRVHDDPPLAFRADLARPGSFVDFRIYLPRLLEDYADRGGSVVRTASAADGLDERHDLIVVAAGGRGLGSLFPRDPSRSRDEPGRLLLAGFFHGVEHTAPIGLHFDIVPEAGEIFQSPVFTFAGRVAGITFEAIPGGPWDGAVRTCWYDDPAGCEQAVLDMLATSGSEILGRVDTSGFALTRPLDLLQGAITPTVRRPWAFVGERTLAVAVGDAAALNDPVTGQGANLASECAWALGEAILAAGSFDERFGHAWERRLAELTDSVTQWTNATLGPPSDQALELLRAASADQAVANAFLESFDDPRRMWRCLATPEGTAAFIEGARAALVDKRQVVG
jgi:hypothetical protein